MPVVKSKEGHKFCYKQEEETRRAQAKTDEERRVRERKAESERSLAAKLQPTISRELELERQKSASLAEKLQDETDTRSRLEREIDDKNAKIVQLNEEIEQLKKNSLGIVPAEDALEKALDGYNDLVSAQQTQGGETNSALDQIEKVFQRFKEAQRNLNEHVEGLVLDQKTEIDSDYVQDRDQCVQELREKIEKGMKLLDREASQYERNKKWAELFQRAQQHAIDHEQRAGDSSKRLEELNGRRQELADSIVASLRRFDTNKVTLDQLSQTLKASEKELNKHAKEVRNLKNQVADLDDTASHDSTVSAVADLDQAKLKRDQVLHHTEQLRNEVAQKSAEQDSLPEYRLLAPPKKLKTHNSFLSTSLTSISTGSPMTRESPFMETSFKDYVVDRELTRNKEGQARVYVCNPNKELNTQVIVKVYQLHSNADTENGIAECNVIRGIDSRNVYKLLDCFPLKHDRLGNVFCIVQPYYSEGDLRDLNEKSMRHGKFTPNDVVLRVAYQVLSALKLIHERGIMHGDLKPHNIFVAPDGRSVVVTEFGINKARLGVINKDTVVDYYAAPEAKRKPGPAGDIWALGCILYEMMSLKRRNMAYEQLYAIADNESTQFQEEIKQDMQQSGLYSEELVKLVAKMLNRAADERPKASEILALDELFWTVAEGEEEQNNTQWCSVCMDKPRTHACVPCGHLCICGDDANAVYSSAKCPLCRAHVSQCKLADRQ